MNQLPENVKQALFGLFEKKKQEEKGETETPKNQYHSDVHPTTQRLIEKHVKAKGHKIDSKTHLENDLGAEEIERIHLALAMWNESGKMPTSKEYDELKTVQDINKHFKKPTKTTAQHVAETALGKNTDVAKNVGKFMLGKKKEAFDRGFFKAAFDNGATQEQAIQLFNNYVRR